jgi:hypothetical protein
MDGPDHDFLITKEEFSRYGGHSLSSKAAERVFNGYGRSYARKKRQELMDYDNFLSNLTFLNPYQTIFSPRKIKLLKLL